MPEPLPPYYLYCNKHKQDMVEFDEHRGMPSYRCEACVADAREKLDLVCAAFRATVFGRKRNL